VLCITKKNVYPLKVGGTTQSVPYTSKSGGICPPVPARIYAHGWGFPYLKKSRCGTCPILPYGSATTAFFATLLGTRQQKAGELHDTVSEQQRIQKHLALASASRFLFQTLNTASQFGHLPLNCQPVSANVAHRTRPTAVRRRLEHAARSCRDDHVASGKEISFSVKQTARDSLNKRVDFNVPPKTHFRGGVDGQSID